MARQDIQEKTSMCMFFSPFFIFLKNINIITFRAIFFSRLSTDRKDVQCAKTSAKQVKPSTAQKVLRKA